MKMPCHLMLTKLSSTAPGQLLAVLDRLVDPLTATLTAKIKSDAGGWSLCLHGVGSSWVNSQPLS